MNFNNLEIPEILTDKSFDDLTHRTVAKLEALAVTENMKVSYAQPLNDKIIDLENAMKEFSRQINLEVFTHREDLKRHKENSQTLRNLNGQRKIEYIDPAKKENEKHDAQGEVAEFLKLIKK